VQDLAGKKVVVTGKVEWRPPVLRAMQPALVVHGLEVVE
jgi:hypothetical protein